MPRKAAATTPDSHGVEFKTLTPVEQWSLVRDALHNAEITYYRLVIGLPDGDPTRDDRLSAEAENVTRLQDEFSRVDAEVPDEQKPSPPQ